MPAIPAWLIEPLWVQFTALLPDRPTCAPTHPLGCHRRRIDDRIVFDKLIQVLQFGCAYDAYDRLVGLVLDDIAVDGCITKAPGGGDCAGGLGRPGQAGNETLIDGRRLRHSPRPGPGRREPTRLTAAGPTLDRLDDLGPLPETITVHLDAGYDSAVTRCCWPNAA